MNQINLFEEEDFYKSEWKDMPEFNMTPEVPILTIKINFKTKESVEEFSKLIGQKIRFTTENYWFPKLNRKAFSDKKYFDEP